MLQHAVLVFLFLTGALCGAELTGASGATLGETGRMAGDFADAPPPDPLPTIALPDDTRTQKTLPLASIQSFKRLIGASNYFKVRDPAFVKGHDYRFFVWSVHGEYDVTTMRKLVQTLNEIQALENFRRTETGNQVWEGAGRSVSGLGEGAKFIVQNPGEAGKAIGRSFSRFGRKVGRLVTKPWKKEERAGDGSNRGSGVGNFFSGAQGRILAYELGVDVYTDNPAVRALLHEVANKRWAGRFGTSMAMSMFVPIPGMTWVRRSLTPGARHPATEILIRDNNRAEMKLLNLRKYKVELGLDNDTVDPLDNMVDNPNFSPREQCYLRHYFTEMNDVEGMVPAMAFLSTTAMPRQAIDRSSQMELYYRYHRRIERLAKWVPLPFWLAALTRSRDLVMILPWDRVEDDDEWNALLVALLRRKQAHGARSIQIWTTGDVTAAALARARGRRIRLQPNLFTTKSFQVDQK